MGRLTGDGVVATVGDARSSGLDASLQLLGLVPRQSGTGGRVKLFGISKRGDPYLRTLLIHGARTVLRQGQLTGWTPWLRA